MSNDRLIPTNGTPSVVTTLIRVNGTEIPRTYGVLTLVVSKEVNRIPYAKIILKDGEPSQEDFPLSNDELFTLGNEIEVLVGYEAKEDVLFKGIIVKQRIKINANGSSLLQLDCRDGLFKTTLTPRNRYFSEIKDSEAFEEIMGEYGLDLNVDQIETTHQELVQFEQTDWRFMVSRAELNGLLCLVDDGSLYIKKPDFEQEPVFPLIYGASILEFDGEIDARQQYANVVARSWDFSGQEILEAEAVEPKLKEAGNLKATDLVGVGGESQLVLRHSGQVAQDELQDWADAQLLRMRMKKMQGRVKFHGSPDVKPGVLVTLQGLGDRFNGPVFVSGVRHEVQGGTWQTDVQFGLADDWFKNSLGDASKKTKLFQNTTGLQIGVVTQLQDDPDSENRILVKSPIIDDASDGVWARVSTLDAGENRGTFFMPEIGDEVVMGFVNGDQRDPVVLGMLHSSTKTAPLEISDDNFEKGYISKSGMKLLFDDDKKSLNIETPAGKKIVLDEDGGVLALEDENNNKIIMDSNGIVIESGGKLELKSTQDLKLEGGINLELKAGASFKAEGTAGAELSTSAVAVLKGSLVQIN